MHKETVIEKIKNGATLFKTEYYGSVFYHLYEQEKEHYWAIDSSIVERISLEESFVEKTPTGMSKWNLTLK